MVDSGLSHTEHSQLAKRPGHRLLTAATMRCDRGCNVVGAVTSRPSSPRTTAFRHMARVGAVLGGVPSECGARLTVDRTGLWPLVFADGWQGDDLRPGPGRAHEPRVGPRLGPRGATSTSRASPSSLGARDGRAATARAAGPHVTAALTVGHGRRPRTGDRDRLNPKRGDGRGVRVGDRSRPRATSRVVPMPS